ncbi:DUF58 domain-containing protein [Chitinimonas koreensis]|uniref:DUF58 domain-containing protein n=1 Tax=Chitinimonas koreensis TaxID=356302 RepID=UPI0003F7C27D|nr:DUF58 domain-containing protein [Chitinimonas koreensis]
MTPSRLLLWLLSGWAALGFAAGLLAPLATLWWALGAVLLLAMAVDAALGWRLPQLRLERQLAGVWPVGLWGDVTLTLHHEGGRRIELALFDDYPTDWELEGLPHATALRSGRYVRFVYRLRPPARGDARFGAAHLRVGSPLGLWLRHGRLGEASEVKVFPDFSKILGHTLTATDQRVPQLGSVRKRRRGEGTDFRQLREYRVGDSLRAIDWKATARQLKPISREYQEERDQQVVFLLDCGRRMLARDGDTSHFDHALNAMLTLAWVAQKQGDAVGVMSFGGEPRWLPPQKGRVGLDRLLTGVYDLQAVEAAPDYLLAAEALLNRLRKRAFVVLITNLRDEDDMAMRQAQRLLSGKHLVLCASLRESALDEAQAAQVNDFGGALRLAATEHYLAERQEAIRRLGMPAHSLIDVTPQKLTGALVDRYLEIKESGQL